MVELNENLALRADEPHEAFGLAEDLFDGVVDEEPTEAFVETLAALANKAISFLERVQLRSKGGPEYERFIGARHHGGEGSRQLSRCGEGV